MSYLCSFESERCGILHDDTWPTKNGNPLKKYPSYRAQIKDKEAQVWEPVPSGFHIGKSAVFFSVDHQIQRAESRQNTTGLTSCGSDLKDWGKPRKMVAFCLGAEKNIAVIFWIDGPNRDGSQPTNDRQMTEKKCAAPNQVLQQNNDLPRNIFPPCDKSPNRSSPRARDWLRYGSPSQQSQYGHFSFMKRTVCLYRSILDVCVHFFAPVTCHGHIDKLIHVLDLRNMDLNQGAKKVMRAANIETCLFLYFKDCVEIEKDSGYRYRIGYR